MTEHFIKKNNILPQAEVDAQAAYVARIREENDRHAETAARRKAFVMTFGCQQNEADS